MVEASEKGSYGIYKKGPVAIKLAKLVVHKGFDIDLETAMLMEKLSQAVSLGQRINRKAR